MGGYKGLPIASPTESTETIRPIGFYIIRV